MVSRKTQRKSTGGCGHPPLHRFNKITANYIPPPQAVPLPLGKGGCGRTQFARFIMLRSNTLIIHYSLFTIHYSLTKKSPANGGRFLFLIFLICYSLSEHCIANLFKAGNVCACYEVAGHTVLCGCVFAVFVNALHNLVELGINLFGSPAVSH